MVAVVLFSLPDVSGLVVAAIVAVVALLVVSLVLVGRASFR